jgi:hypothetical protein
MPSENLQPRSDCAAGCGAMSRMERMERLVVGMLAMICAQTAVAQVYKCVDDARQDAFFRSADLKLQKRCCRKPSVAGCPENCADPPVYARGYAQASADRTRKNVFCFRCKTLKEEEAWLLSPRGSAVQGRDARLRQCEHRLSTTAGKSRDLHRAHAIKENGRQHPGHRRRRKHPPAAEAASLGRGLRGARRRGRDLRRLPRAAQLRRR